MTPYPPGVLKFTKARFSALFATKPEDAEERERLRWRWRRTWLPPAWMTQEWYVAQTFRYWTEGEGKGEYFDVPGGDPEISAKGAEPDRDILVFDGASVPWPLTLLVPKTHPIYFGAAALHDYLYCRRYMDVPRRRADDYFLDALLISGLNWLWAGAMWRAVRSGGWAMWYRRRPDTALGRFLNATPGIVRAPLVFLATAVLGFVGLLSDVFFGFWRVRSRDREIRARDR